MERHASVARLPLPQRQPLSLQSGSPSGHCARRYSLGQDGGGSQARRGLPQACALYRCEPGHTRDALLHGIHRDILPLGTIVAVQLEDLPGRGTLAPMVQATALAGQDKGTHLAHHPTRRWHSNLVRAQVHLEKGVFRDALADEPYAAPHLIPLGPVPFPGKHRPDLAPASYQWECGAAGSEAPCVGE